MSGADLAFYGCAVVSVYAGWRVFRTGSMVRASFFLLASFVAVGIVMLLVSAAYLGVALAFMMAVEMMVMALFMVMFMMNPAGLNPMSMVHQPRIAAAAGVAAFSGLAAVALAGVFPRDPAPSGLASVSALGREMLGPSMLVFETAGIVLLATMIGVVVLSSRRGRFGPADEGSLPPPLEPGGKPAGGPDTVERGKSPRAGHGHHGH